MDRRSAANCNLERCKRDSLSKWIVKADLETSQDPLTRRSVRKSIVESTGKGVFGIFILSPHGLVAAPLLAIGKEPLAAVGHSLLGSRAGPLLRGDLNARSEQKYQHPPVRLVL